MVVAPFKVRLTESGTVRDIKKMIVRISGLASCLNGQIVDLGEGNKGIVMGFDEQSVLALLLGDESQVRLGQTVTGVSEPFTVPVGDAFLGRMTDALGNPVDGRGPVEATARGNVFSPSASLPERAPVDEFLETGTKIVDALVPIGRGQRQLIMGDRMTGKTTIALDAILHQRGSDVVCIYCAIGKAVASLERVAGHLIENHAMARTAIVAASDSSTPGEQYLVPFAAATLGEYFMRRGHDVLVVFDDLTKHAWAYRQLSLLLERPPGREAYPGDIFYVQTQLMERAGRLNTAMGGGSMTFLALADTLQGDMTGYIPSNLISICDGMVALNTTLFAEGVRPAVDIGLSLSIVGARAQPPVLRELGSAIRAQYVQHTELLKLNRLQTALSRQAEAVIRRGHAIMAVLQQPPHRPVRLAEQVLLLYALNAGRFDGMEPATLAAGQARLAGEAASLEPGLFEELERKGTLSPELERRIAGVLQAAFGEPGA
jgi:F-type H+-transporting ATPase subunit alpha